MRGPGRGRQPPGGVPHSVCRCSGLRCRDRTQRCTARMWWPQDTADFRVRHRLRSACGCTDGIRRRGRWTGPSVCFDVTMAHLREEKYWVATRPAGEHSCSVLVFRIPEPSAFLWSTCQSLRSRARRVSLLVMPAHSLADQRSVHGPLSDYVEAIRAVRAAFRRIMRLRQRS